VRPGQTPVPLTNLASIALIKYMAAWRTCAIQGVGPKGWIRPAPDRSSETLLVGGRLHAAALRGTLWCMATPLTVSIPHQLGRAEARRRIETGFSKLVHLFPGGGGTCSERWDGDRLTFGVAAMGQTVNGVIDVGDAVVTMVIELPGVLGMIANSLKERLQKLGQLLLTKE
jgi:hypothetical protein